MGLTLQVRGSRAWLKILEDLFSNFYGTCKLSLHDYDTRNIRMSSDRYNSYDHHHGISIDWKLLVQDHCITNKC